MIFTGLTYCNFLTYYTALLKNDQISGMRKYVDRYPGMGTPSAMSKTLYFIPWNFGHNMFQLYIGDFRI